MTRRQRSLVPDVLLLAAAPGLLLATSLASVYQRVRWARLCERICGPFLPADASALWVESFRRAMDWQTPLAIAAAATLVLGALAFLHRARGARSHARR